MRCPFLHETSVRYCAVSPYRKLVPEASIQERDQRCSSIAHRDCPVAREYLQAKEKFMSCPFLQDAMVQYCAAAPVRMLVLFAEGMACPCLTAAHTQCKTYVEHIKADLVERA